VVANASRFLSGWGRWMRLPSGPDLTPVTLADSVDVVVIVVTVTSSGTGAILNA